ncbi:NAD(P)H-binding protein [Conexibacter woesei]|uniref:NmrA family protein n=1 Tax=Conexibacter woesei (strain DSM 14684 / CCUG 47730 / CIP 108061 / JCM 11494 / NBRC 100937 / ID131577) TaxID=469383 RepID=D3FE78_CONWI|nr:NAD(P)H-binding protein [Conexibacter woesei]ADB53570.1 NmrA family protein [Conexibacter woesei DSM 14684]
MILITAPTSTIGSQLVTDLLEAGAPLRLIARRPEQIAPEVRERVDVVVGSHGDAAVIDRALNGVETVFWLSPNLPDSVAVNDSFAGFARPAVEALARHSVERVVGISALGRGTPQAARAGHVTATLALDDLIASSGVAYRALTCPSLMHNLLNHVGAIKQQGAFFMAADADLQVPTVASRDVAAAAARLLLDPSWTGAGEVPCLGPEDLSPNDWARVVSDVLGTEVRYQQVPTAALIERLVGFGYTDAMAQAMADMFDAKNDGLDNAEPRTAASTTPTTFRQWCEDVLEPAVHRVTA